jgi:cell wall-associated NlpC family hydrolase
MFITASSAIYDTSSATAENRTQEARVVTYQVPVATATPSLIRSLTVFDNLKTKIGTLEETLQEKETDLYVLKNAKIEALAALRKTSVTTDQALIDLKAHVGKTPYGFGSNPTRWDCSGLTLWFYETYRGITLPHSATAQQRGGEKVDAPIPGDLVAFVHKGYQNAYHIGVYVGGGLFIHALNPQRDTVLDNVQNFAEKENSRVEYIRYP